MSKRPDQFYVHCCGKKRGVFPGGVLICGYCDYGHPGASSIPNEQYAKDVPLGTGRLWEVPRVPPAAA